MYRLDMDVKSVNKFLSHSVPSWQHKLLVRTSWGQLVSEGLCLRRKN